jgi:hypothetical protein
MTEWVDLARINAGLICGEEAMVQNIRKATEEVCQRLDQINQRLDQTNRLKAIELQILLKMPISQEIDDILNK